MQMYTRLITPALAFQHSTHKHCLQISGLRMWRVMLNRFPVKKIADWVNFVTFWSLITWKQICASLIHCKVMKENPIRLISRKLAANIIVARVPKGSFLPRFLAYFVFFCFERSCPKPNIVVSLNSKYLAPPKIFGLSTPLAANLGLSIFTHGLCDSHNQKWTTVCVYKLNKPWLNQMSPWKNESTN